MFTQYKEARSEAGSSSQITVSKLSVHLINSNSLLFPSHTSSKEHSLSSSMAAIPLRVLPNTVYYKVQSWDPYSLASILLTVLHVSLLVTSNCRISRYLLQIALTQGIKCSCAAYIEVRGGLTEKWDTPFVPFCCWWYNNIIENIVPGVYIGATTSPLPFPES